LEKDISRKGDTNTVEGERNKRKGIKVVKGQKKICRKKGKIGRGTFSCLKEKGKKCEKKNPEPGSSWREVKKGGRGLFRLKE